jgi:hypothetical protein
MEKLKNIRILSFAKFQSVLMALVGIMCGIIYSIGGLIIDALVSMGLLSFESVSSPGLSYGTILAFGALVGIPIIFAIIGFLVGIVEAVLYNLFARWFGGLKFDFDK